MSGWRSSSTGLRARLRDGGQELARALAFRLREQLDSGRPRIGLSPLFEQIMDLDPKHKASYEALLPELAPVRKSDTADAKNDQLKAMPDAKAAAEADAAPTIRTQGPMRGKPVPQPIRISPDDVNDPRIDMILEEERSVRKVASQVDAASPLRRFFLSSMFYTALVGALGGFLGWAVVEPYFDDDTVISGRIREVSPEPAIAPMPVVPQSHQDRQS